MKVMHVFTRKNLRQNTHRTIVTIVGILLTSVLLFSIGFAFTIIRNRDIEKTKLHVGKYHFAYQDVDASIISMLEQEDSIRQLEVESVIYRMMEGYHSFVLRGRNSYELSNISLLQGEFPKKEGELLVTTGVLQSYHKTIGDSITIDGKEYTIVGFYEWDNSYADHFLYTYYTGVQEKNNVYMTLQSTKDAYGQIHALSASLGFQSSYDRNGLRYEHENIHDNLLRAYGQYRSTVEFQRMFILLFLLLTVLSIASIFVVYNAFAISVTERKKTMGILSSIGATPKQLFSSVFYEATLLALIAVPIGFLVSWAGSSLVVWILNTFFYEILEVPLKTSIYPFYLVISFIFIVVTIYLSAFFPAMRAKEVGPLDSIRMTKDIKIRRKRVKSGKWVRMLFGIEGEIAYKNKKRNRKKYRVVSISLFIGIVLFMTFSAYLDLQRIVMKDNNEDMGYEYDVSISLEGNSEIKDQYLKLLLDGVEVKDILRHQSFVGSLTVPDEYYTDAFKESNMKNYISIVSIPDEGFKNFTKRLGYQEEKPIFFNKIYYANELEDGTKKIIDYQLLHSIEGATLEVKALSDSSQQVQLVLDDFYMTEEYYQEKNNFLPMIYVSYTQYQELISLSDDKGFKESADTESYYIKTDDYRKLEHNYQDLKTQFTTIHVSYQNNSYLEYENLLMLQVQNGIVLGAILLLGVIAITSVFNTIYTSMQLRKKEFAMLRSIGMGQKQFYKMICLESIFFALQSLFYGILVSSGLIHLLHKILNIGNKPNEIVDYPYPFMYLWITIGAVILIVFITMLYSTRKVKKDNIIDVLKEETF